MAGVPMNIIYEEDVTAGWLLPGGKPRVPMLFLCGQTQPLPGPARDAIARYQGAGGRVYSDAESAEFPGAKHLELRTDPGAVAIGRIINSDAAWPELQPLYETLASGLVAAVGDSRRFPVDTSDPWVAKGQLDGGAIRYLMFSSETSPFPWSHEVVWWLGGYYDKSSFPKVVSAKLPAAAAAGAIYDVFDSTLVKPAISADRTVISVDLRLIPGRLFALTPEPIAAPRLLVSVQGDTLRARCQIVGASGKPMAARVPLRIRLQSGGTKAADLIRGTGPDGTLAWELPMPAMGSRWNLEVMELVGGVATTAEVANTTPPQTALAVRPDVDVRRETQLRTLLAEAEGTLCLRVESSSRIDRAQVMLLARALKARGVALTELDPKSPAPPRVQLVLGELPARSASDGVLSSAVDFGLFDLSITPGCPGPGRGFVAPLFSPRAPGEHAIALVGGDAAGLAKTIDAFIRWLGTSVPNRSGAAAASEAQAVESVQGRPAEATPSPHVGDLLGARLADVIASADGKHVVVSSDGYLKNLALIEDQGSAARVVQAVRVGQGPALQSLYASNDGKRFGAQGRHVARFGQGFELLNGEGGVRDIFAGFGDRGGTFQHKMSGSADGEYVLAPGTCGVVCWRKTGNEWHEAWAIDYWKQFPKLEWPVSGFNEFDPYFHTHIPPGASYGLILFAEHASLNWTMPNNIGRAWLAAVSLSDGNTLWKWDVPISGALIHPDLVVSPDGTQVYVQVQKGSFNEESFEFFGVSAGKLRARWATRAWPIGAAVADHTGSIAVAYKGRHVQSRRADGKLMIDRVWDALPTALAFTADGRDLLVVDQFGRLTRLARDGTEVWQFSLGAVSRLAVRGHRIYAAGRDGRLRAVDDDGRLAWTIDCTPSLLEDDPAGALLAGQNLECRLHAASRPATTRTDVPAGPNLLRGTFTRQQTIVIYSHGKRVAEYLGAQMEKADLTIGGTQGWCSEGVIQAQAMQMVDGRMDDVTKPWLSTRELFWAVEGTRQVWVRIDFREPTDVHSLTVYENPNHPESWPTEGVVQVWDEKLEDWRCVAHSAFMSGPTNTYDLNLKKVKTFRYVPWTPYAKNLYTSEIEVR